MTQNYRLTRQAILEKKQVFAVYENHDREMCPHVLGIRDGKGRCLFYQFGGGSRTGIFSVTDPRAYQNWRCMEVEKLSELTIRDGPWFSISRDTHRQTCVGEIDLEVAGWE